MGRLRTLQPRVSKCGADSEVVRQAPAQVLGKVEAAAGMAALDRFALSQVRARNTATDSRRAPAGGRSDERKSRRDQGPDHRTRRQDLDGQGLRQARTLRRLDVD